VELTTTATTTAPAASAGVFLPRSTRFIVGVDLGQSQDPTAIAVVEHIRGVLDPNTTIERHTGTGSLPQKPAERFDVRHLERLPLGTSYPAVVAHVQNLLSRPPLCGDITKIKPADLVIDQGGVGAAVGDLFEQAGMRALRVSITAGSEVTLAGRDRWHVAKTALVSVVDAALHTGTLRFATALTQGGALREELKDFRRHVGAAGRATFQARAGRHDDLVLAVSIACWWASRKAMPPRMGHY
jgi:hypothetical protein